MSPPGSSSAVFAAATGNEHRLEIPAGAFDGDLEDDDKYQRRRRTGFLSGRRAIVGLFCLLCIGIAGYQVFA